MKLIDTSEPRGFGKSFGSVLKGVFVELACWIRKGLSLGVMLFLAFTTLSFLNRGAGYLKALAVKAVGLKNGLEGTVRCSRGEM